MKGFNINYNIKAAVPPELKIDECDLASILFNTIDNDIEACSHVEGFKKRELTGGLLKRLLISGNFQ